MMAVEPTPIRPATRRVLPHNVEIEASIPGGVRVSDLDKVFDRLIATCPCDSCERYRKWFIARAAYWAVKIEQSLRLR